MKSVGEKIKELRKNKRISQEQLAFELDVSKQTIYNWESNKSEPSLKNIENMCDFFEVDSSYFIINKSNELLENSPLVKNIFIDENNIPIPVKTKKLNRNIIFILLILNLFLWFVSLMLTIISGIILFTPNIGYTNASTTPVTITTFIILLLLSTIFFIFNILLIALFVKYKKYFNKSK